MPCVHKPPFSNPLLQYPSQETNIWLSKTFIIRQFASMQIDFVCTITNTPTTCYDSLSFPSAFQRFPSIDPPVRFNPFSTHRECSTASLLLNSESRSTAQTLRAASNSTLTHHSAHAESTWDFISFGQGVASRSDLYYFGPAAFSLFLSRVYHHVSYLFSATQKWDISERKNYRNIQAGKMFRYLLSCFWGFATQHRLAFTTLFRIAVGARRITPHGCRRANIVLYS